mgnify:CR=1 FL=1
MTDLEKMQPLWEFPSMIAEMQIKLAEVERKNPGADLSDRKKFIDRLSNLCAIYNHVYYLYRKHEQRHTQSEMEKSAILDEYLKLKETLTNAEAL